MRPGDKPQSPKCPLGAIQLQPMDIDAIKREAWLTQGILIISKHDVRLGWDEAQLVKNLGDKLYGRRASTG